MGTTISITGTFGVKVDKLNKETAQKLAIDGPSVTIPVNIGEMKVLYFDAMAGEGYKISSIGTVKSGCCGDGIEMHISAYRENLNFPYFYRESVALANGTVPAVDMLTSVATERAYLVLDGAYWFDQNSADFSVTKQ